MLVGIAMTGIIIKTNKKGGTIRLNTGRMVNINGKFKLGQEVSIHNNNIFITAEEKPWQKEQVSWETES